MRAIITSLVVASTVGALSAAALAEPLAATGRPSSSVASPPPSPPLPPADPALREQLRALVRQAGERIEQGDRAGAVALLEQARRLRPDPSLDYNLAVAYGELGRQPEAAAALERFVATADPQRFLPERLATAKQQLSGYQQTLARLRARVVLPSAGSEASLRLDELALHPLAGGALAAPLWLMPGRHQLRFSAPGCREYQVAVELAAGESREVSGELYRDDLAAGLLAEAKQQETSKEPPPIYKKWWFWTAVGGGAITAVALVAAGAAGAFNHTAPGTVLDPVDFSK
jgi:tetratricopeptide (TPR) repeat protein